MPRHADDRDDRGNDRDGLRGDGRGDSVLDDSVLDDGVRDDSATVVDPEVRRDRPA